MTRQQLHDRIDALESVQEKWRKAVEAIRVEMGFIARHSSDWGEVFLAVNLFAAKRLDELTTEAAKLGAKSK